MTRTRRYRSSHSTVKVARLLLTFDADRNAGFLWNGTYPVNPG
jgi:hypothetical protein